MGRDHSVAALRCVVVQEPASNSQRVILRDPLRRCIAVTLDSNAGNAGALARRGPEARLTFEAILLREEFRASRSGAGEGARVPSRKLELPKRNAN